MIIHDFEQRSPEWYKVREGKITGTSVTSILGKDTLQKTKDAINNLAMKLAIESVFGMIESDYINFDMQRGIDSEPSALDLLADILGQDFIDVSRVGFIELSEHVGCSPDALTSVRRTAEVKCPKSESGFKLCLSGEIDSDYYKQVQHQIYCLDADAAYFMSYWVQQGKEYHYLKLVERDQEMTALIKTRCDDVIDKKLKYIPQLLDVKLNSGINLLTPRQTVNS